MPNPYFGNYAPQYTSELGAAVLAPQLNAIDTGEEESEATADQEGEAGGLVGKFSEGGAKAAAQSNAALNTASVFGNFSNEAAGATERERMTEEGQEFQSQEQIDQQNFQEMLAQQGYQFQGNQAALARHQEDLITPSSILGMSAGIIGAGGSKAIGSFL